MARRVGLSRVWFVVGLFALALTASGCLQDPNKEANRRIVEVASLLREADQTSDPQKRLTALTTARQNVDFIIKELKQSDAAAKLASGQSFGEISVKVVNDRFELARREVASIECRRLPTAACLKELYGASSVLPQNLARFLMGVAGQLAERGDVAAALRVADEARGLAISEDKVLLEGIEEVRRQLRASVATDLELATLLTEAATPDERDRLRAAHARALLEKQRQLPDMRVLAEFETKEARDGAFSSLLRELVKIEPQTDVRKAIAQYWSSVAEFNTQEHRTAAVTALQNGNPKILSPFPADKAREELFSLIATQYAREDQIDDALAWLTLIKDELGFGFDRRAAFMAAALKAPSTAAGLADRFFKSKHSKNSMLEELGKDSALEDLAVTLSSRGDCAIALRTVEAITYAPRRESALAQMSVRQKDGQCLAFLQPKAGTIARDHLRLLAIVAIGLTRLEQGELQSARDALEIVRAIRISMVRPELLRAPDLMRGILKKGEIREFTTASLRLAVLEAQLGNFEDARRILREGADAALALPEDDRRLSWSAPVILGRYFSFEAIDMFASLDEEQSLFWWKAGAAWISDGPKREALCDGSC